MVKKYKIVGILGGMGPFATLEFFQRILQLTPARKDWDHLRVVIDNNPHIPSRSRHYLYGEESPLPGMIDSCRRLEAYPVDFIVLPCNSASSFLNDLQDKITVPILNIMEITSNAIKNRLQKTSIVAVLGAVITYEKKTYLPYLNKIGLKYVHHNNVMQRAVEYLIEQVKVNKVGDDVKGCFIDLIKNIKHSYGVDVIVLGCTELSYFSEIQCGIELIDSSYELAKHTIWYAKHGVSNEVPVDHIDSLREGV